MRIAIISPASLPATQFGGILFVAVHIAKIAVKENTKLQFILLILILQITQQPLTEIYQERKMLIILK